MEGRSVSGVSLTNPGADGEAEVNEDLAAAEAGREEQVCALGVLRGCSHGGSRASGT